MKPHPRDNAPTPRIIPTPMRLPSKRNVRAFPMEIKSFSIGIQIVFHWNLKRFPMKNETNFNESQNEFQ
jgi:hypothetical protein